MLSQPFRTEWKDQREIISWNFIVYLFLIPLFSLHKQCQTQPDIRTLSASMNRFCKYMVPIYRIVSKKILNLNIGVYYWQDRVC
jgi:hypothetical protein